MSDAANIAPFYRTQRVISRRHPLFPPVTVTAVREVEPGVWRIEWEDASAFGCAPITGSAPAAAYVREGSGR